MSDITYRMLPLPAVLMMVAEVPDKIVDQMNNYLDKLLLQEDRKSSAHTLVGQINQGEQLSMDYKSKELTEVRFFLQDIAVQYVLDFFHSTGQNLDGNREIEIDDLWSVHSYAGDYNPIHDHGTKTTMGISCTTWTKVPEQITNQAGASEKGFSLYNSSGSCDGYLEFVFGPSAVWDKERLKPTQMAMFKPTVGNIYVFPSWLQHMVYPFKGEGERRTVAANFNAFPKEKE